MDDYIARKTAVDTCIAVQKEVEAIMFEDGPFHTDNAKNVAKLLKKFATQMSAPPAANVAPVVHGRWDSSGRYQFPSGAKAIRCSVCGCALSESEYRLFNWNYCPVCGAKMDGDGDD